MIKKYRTLPKIIETLNSIIEEINFNNKNDTKKTINIYNLKNQKVQINNYEGLDLKHLNYISIRKEDSNKFIEAFYDTNKDKFNQFSSNKNKKI